MEVGVGRGAVYELLWVLEGGYLKLERKLEHTLWA